MHLPRPALFFLYYCYKKRNVNFKKLESYFYLLKI